MRLILKSGLSGSAAIDALMPTPANAFEDLWPMPPCLHDGPDYQPDVATAEVAKQVYGIEVE
jgi:hypothetical protein